MILSSASDMPDIQRFDDEPTDEQLGTWVAPGCAEAENVWIRRSPGQLVVRARPVPMWFLFACLALPAGGLGAWLWNLIAEGPESAFDIAVTAYLLISIPIVFGIATALIIYIHRRATRAPACFTVDIPQQTLTLPHFDVTVPRERVIAVIEVIGPFKVGNLHHSKYREWSVLVREPDGRVTRYPLKLPNHYYDFMASPKAARALSEGLAVPLRTVPLAEATVA